MMRRRRFNMLALAALTLAAAPPAGAQGQPDPALLARLRPALEQDRGAPVLGNPEGDVTLVEFFDYNCGYCRRAMPAIEALVAADPNVRVVLREWPVFGEGSVFAAAASLASWRQGKYWAFHRRMMGMNGRAERATVLRAAAAVGLDTDRLQQDMRDARVRKHLENSVRLAEELNLLGTPSFVIGNEVAFGYRSTDELAEMVAAVRAAPQAPIE